MNNKHTPGPWKIKTNGNVGNCIEADCGKRLFEGDSGYRTVALFQCCEPTGLYYAEEENKLANARLIASAPDLLDALEMVMKKYSKHLDGFAFEQCHAAIAKATGNN